MGYTLRRLLSINGLSKLTLVSVVVDSPAHSYVPTWRVFVNGRFTVKLVRKLLVLLGDPGPSLLWRKIWEFVGPHRAPFTLLFSLHGDLPTKPFLWNRKILDSTC